MPTPYNVCNGNAAAGSATLALTVGSGTPSGQSTKAGDLVYVIAGDTNAQAITGVTDTRGNSYAKQASSGGTQRCNIWSSLTTTALVSGTDIITITYTLTTGNKAAIARGCSGVQSGTADGSNGASNAGSTSPSSGATAALTQNTELAIGAIQNASGGGTPSGLSFGTGLTVSNITEFEEITTSGTALTASGTITSAAWGAVIATFRLGTGGGLFPVLAGAI